MRAEQERKGDSCMPICVKSEISGENAEVFGRNPQRVLWKTLLRLEENASAFELKHKDV